MGMVELIQRKKEGKALSAEEIQGFVEAVTQGTVPEYQVSALLMAICFQGMTGEETVALTLAMAKSGDMLDLSSLPGTKVDKHSTGGVGDKTTLIIGPLAAACGVTVAKMSGRGLGHTGGTVDKLESIPGFRTALSREEFFSVVRETGISVVGQSGNLCPADKKLYALRDVTATVDSIPLIAASIMSKKLAAGADAILLDVKTGSGALLHSEAQCRALAKEMVEIGTRAGRTVRALLTNMDAPLGNCIGNALEVKEAVQVLRGQLPGDPLTELCITLAAHMVELAGKAPDLPSATQKVREALNSGAGFSTLCRMVEAQGGDSSVLEHTEKLPQSPCSLTVLAPLTQPAFLASMDSRQLGLAAMALGAGRETADSQIDLGAGIVLSCHPGDPISPHQPLATLYAHSPSLLPPAQSLLLSSLTFTPQPPQKPLPMILDVIQ